MKMLLFAQEVVALWAAQLKVVCIPAIVVGAAIGCILRHWIACLAVSYAAALGLVAIVPQHQLHHPMSVGGLLIWSAVLALPAILSSTSPGYFAARWNQTRRARQQITQLEGAECLGARALLPIRSGLFACLLSVPGRRLTRKACSCSRSAELRK
jgi:hypothetical protein